MSGSTTACSSTSGNAADDGANDTAKDSTDIAAFFRSGDSTAPAAPAAASVAPRRRHAPKEKMLRHLREATRISKKRGDESYGSLAYLEGESCILVRRLPFRRFFLNGEVKVTFEEILPIRIENVAICCKLIWIDPSSVSTFTVSGRYHITLIQEVHCFDVKEET